MKSKPRGECGVWSLITNIKIWQGAHIPPTRTADTVHSMRFSLQRKVCEGLGVPWRGMAHISEEGRLSVF